MQVHKGVIIMQRVNVSLDDETYEILRFLSFKNRKSMSEIIRESISKNIRTKDKKESKLVLDAKDKKELLAIIEKNEYISESDFEKELGL
jgi:Arc/MetJ-type ribon-helix-helix transcriptional regulator